MHPGPPLSRASARARRGRALALALVATLGHPSLAAAEPAADGDASADASADASTATPPPTSLPPLRRPLSLLVGFGPSVGINPRSCYGGYFYWDPLWQPRSGYYGLGCGGALKASQELAYHFSGDATGPALGVVVQEEFLVGGAYFGLVVAPKFSWDIPLIRGRGVYLTPSVAVGYHLLAWKGYPRVHAGEAQAGAAVKVALTENLLLWLQPAVFDFIFTPGFFIPRYDLLLGLGAGF